MVVFVVVIELDSELGPPSAPRLGAGLCLSRNLPILLGISRAYLHSNRAKRQRSHSNMNFTNLYRNFLMHRPSTELPSPKNHVGITNKPRRQPHLAAGLTIDQPPNPPTAEVSPRPRTAARKAVRKAFLRERRKIKRLWRDRDRGDQRAGCKMRQLALLVDWYGAGTDCLFFFFFFGCE